VHGNKDRYADYVKRDAQVTEDPRRTETSLPDHWRPRASFEVMRRRAELLVLIREFMRDRAILEVDTPILDTAGNTDPNIESLNTIVKFPDSAQHHNFYLHTSPEFAMKRLLAAGSGPIYQICKVFRDNESGRLHQVEFTMLEWYRPGFDHHDLMDELGELLEAVDLDYPAKRTYASVFRQHTGLDPHSAGLEDLRTCASRLGLSAGPEDRALLLDMIFSHSITPNLGRDRPQLIYDYPACQAALARINIGSPDVAERFELFINGIEIANGYNELCDIYEQNSRFWKDNTRRKNSNLPVIPIDKRLLAALQDGMPASAGVAIGLDRLLMAIIGCPSLADVLSYPLSAGN